MFNDTKGYPSIYEITVKLKVHSWISQQGLQQLCPAMPTYCICLLYYIYTQYITHEDSRIHFSLHMKTINMTDPSCAGVPLCILSSPGPWSSPLFLWHGWWRSSRFPPSVWGKNWAEKQHKHTTAALNRENTHSHRHMSLSLVRLTNKYQRETGVRSENK